MAGLEAVVEHPAVLVVVSEEERGVLTPGEHLDVLAEVQEHCELLVEVGLMAGLEAVGEHLGAAEENQEELKNEKNT